MEYLNHWRKNLIDSANMTYKCECEIAKYQEEAANEEARDKIKKFLEYKAKKLIEMFPEQAKFFLEHGWKSPIIQPEEQYPFRPKVEGLVPLKNEIMFKDYEKSVDKDKFDVDPPSKKTILRDLKVGDKVVYNSIDGLRLYGELKKINDNGVHIYVDNDVIKIPLISFSNPKNYLQKDE